MAFLKNAWYVAAWEDEVLSAALFHRRILGDQILLARDEKNVAHALRDRCPHRSAPLHLGTHCGSSVQCGYHGLTFGFDGRSTLDGVSAEEVGAAHAGRVHLASTPRELLAILRESRRARAHV